MIKKESENKNKVLPMSTRKKERKRKKERNEKKNK